MEKKKVIILISLTMFAFGLIGCSTKTPPKKLGNGFPVPKMTSYASYGEPGEYYYVVDERTGVVYISYNSVKRHSMTVALNADGTPVTKEQLNSYVKEN